MPELVHHQVGDGQIQLSPAGSQPVLELPVTIGDGLLITDLDISLDQVEWGTRLDLALRPLDPGADPEARYPLLSVQVRGGQGHNHLDAQVQRAALPWGAYATVGPLSWRGRLSAALDPDLQRARIRAEPDPGTNQGAVDHEVSGASVFPFPPAGHYALVISTGGQGCLGGRFRLRRLALRGPGVGIGPTPEAAAPAVGRAALLVTEGWPERALEALGSRQDPSADRVRLAALDDETRLVLAQALATSPTPELLADQLLLDPRVASLRARPDWPALPLRTPP